jgi:hypothetical protein
MISDVPGWNILPATIFTCGRSTRPAGVAPQSPRSTACPNRAWQIDEHNGFFGDELLPVNAGGNVGQGFDDRGGRAVDAAALGLRARRMTRTLSGWPVATRVSSSPAASMSTVAKTYTTSAIPPAVRRVVSLRAVRLRAM